MEHKTRIRLRQGYGATCPPSQGFGAAGENENEDEEDCRG
jgi:hypothetical protein